MNYIAKASVKYFSFDLSDSVNWICTLQEEQKFFISLILMVPVYVVQSVSRTSCVCFLSCIFVQWDATHYKTRLVYLIELRYLEWQLKYWPWGKGILYQMIVCENTYIPLFTSLSCCGIFIFIKTIDLKIKYIYSNNSHCIGLSQQRAGTPLVI
jgi:hypothetical protein